jgi:hypothetical protein
MESVISQIADRVPAWLMSLRETMPSAITILPSAKRARPAPRVDDTGTVLLLDDDAAEKAPSAHREIVVKGVTTIVIDDEDD